MKAQRLPSPTQILTYIALANASITLANQLNHYYTVYKSRNTRQFGFSPNTSHPSHPNSHPKEIK